MIPEKKTEAKPGAPVAYLSLIREKYRALGHRPYRWAVNGGTPPFTPLARPLSRSRLALVASGGIYLRGQVAFHYRDDTSYRVIPADADPAELRVTHFGYDVTDPRRDPAIVFPVAALRAMVDRGKIGSLSPRTYTCMGGIYSSRRVKEELAPALAEGLTADVVDAVMLVPACPVCHQTMALVARHLEEGGIPTLCLTSARDITRAVNPPRAAFLDFPIGYIGGVPHDRTLQEAIMAAALDAFDGITEPGHIETLPFQWPGGTDWKAAAVNRQDVRMPRADTPRYQEESDPRV